MRRIVSIAAVCLGMTSAAQAAPIVTNTTNATILANAIAGPGITILNATFTTNIVGTPSGTFTNGSATVGLDTGTVLTTGTTACIPGPNDVPDCTGAVGAGSLSELAFTFTAVPGQVSFPYVFGSEEYNESVGLGFNDTFQLLLNGVNIAVLPGTSTPVSIDTVNCAVNPTFYRNNSPGPTNCPNLTLDIQYDGLTVVLQATGSTTLGTNTVQFRIFDAGDQSLDSGVFIQAASFQPSGAPVPEPASMLLLGSGLVGIAGRRWRVVRPR